MILSLCHSVRVCVQVRACEYTNERDVTHIRRDWLAHAAARLSFAVIADGNQ